MRKLFFTTTATLFFLPSRGGEGGWGVGEAYFYASLSSPASRLFFLFFLSLSLSLLASRSARARRDEVFVPRGSLICVRGRASTRMRDHHHHHHPHHHHRAEQRGVQVSRKEEKKCALTTRRKDRAWRPSFSFSFSLA